jgi:hypothetical protein
MALCSWTGIQHVSEEHTISVRLRTEPPNIFEKGCLMIFKNKTRVKIHSFGDGIETTGTIKGYYSEGFIYIYCGIR